MANTNKSSFDNWLNSLNEKWYLYHTQIYDTFSVNWYLTPSGNTVYATVKKIDSTDQITDIKKV